MCGNERISSAIFVGHDNNKIQEFHRETFFGIRTNEENMNHLHTNNKIYFINLLLWTRKYKCELSVIKW